MFISETKGWIKHETHVIIVNTEATNHEELLSSELEALQLVVWFALHSGRTGWASWLLWKRSRGTLMPNVTVTCLQRQLKSDKISNRHAILQVSRHPMKSNAPNGSTLGVMLKFYVLLQK